jgi:hypothetical protein
VSPARFGKGGEVLFDKICRKNAITHRLTAPASPNQNGKVERFHGTFRPDFLDQVGPFTSIEETQAAVDVWVAEYNEQRPHQGLDDKVPVTPAERFAPVPAADRELIELWLPPALVGSPPVSVVAVVDGEDEQPEPAASVPAAWTGGPVEFDRVVPPSGNMIATQRQFWMGPTGPGWLARIWADVDMIHVLIGGTRAKTVRSHLSVNDLAKLVAQGASNAGPSPLPPIEDGDAVEVERAVSGLGHVSLAGHQFLAAEILGGRPVGIRIEPATLMFYDLATRELLRTRANPLTAEQTKGLRGVRPAGPLPRPSTEPIRVQRRASNTGVIMVAETTLAIELDDEEVRVVRRTTTQPVRSIKGQRPRNATSAS